MRQYRDLSKSRDFLLLWVASTISSFGDWFLQAAIYLYLYRLTGSAVHVAALGTARFLVASAMGPPAGVAADRLDRKTILVSSDLIRFGLYMVMSIYSTVGAIYALSLTASVFDGLSRPAASAIVPSLVGKGQVVSANSLLGSTRNLQMFIAPAVAGLFIAAWGPVAAFSVNGLTFLGSAVTLWFMRPRPVAAGSGPALSWMSSLGEGFSYVRGNPFLLNLLVAALIAGVGAAVADSMEVVYVEEFLGAADYGYGLVLSAAGAGALVGAVAVAPVSNLLPRDALFGWSLALVGASLVLYPIIPGLEVMLVVVFTGSIFASFYQISRQTMIQERCPERQMGRVFGLLGALGSVTYLASKAVSGFLAEAMGVANLFAGAGVFVVAGGFMYVVRTGRGGCAPSRTHAEPPLVE